MSGPGVAPDGSPVLLYLSLPGADDATTIHEAIPAPAAILELGCGTGRVTNELVRRGHAVTAVDNSAEMLSHIDAAAEPVLADILTLDLAPRRWPVVLMGSYLINDGESAAFLATAARHVAPGGCILVERHAPGWVDTAEPARNERDGVVISLVAVSHDAPGTMTATVVYEIGAQRFEQTFTAHDVDDVRLAALAAAAGCEIDAVLDAGGTWVRLRPIRDLAPPRDEFTAEPRSASS